MQSRASQQNPTNRSSITNHKITSIRLAVWSRGTSRLTLLPSATEKAKREPIFSMMEATRSKTSRENLWSSRKLIGNSFINFRRKNSSKKQILVATAKRPREVLEQSRAPSTSWAMGRWTPAQLNFPAKREWPTPHAKSLTATRSSTQKKRIN